MGTVPGLFDHVRYCFLHTLIVMNHSTVRFIVAEGLVRQLMRAGPLRSVSSEFMFLQRVSSCQSKGNDDASEALPRNCVSSSNVNLDVSFSNNSFLRGLEELNSFAIDLNFDSVDTLDHLSNDKKNF
jgi:hypothetical protein